MIKLTIFFTNLLRKMSYYAVAKGRFPGVYFSWSDCKKQVDQFPGAKFRKFSTEVEAKNFVRQFSANSSQPTTSERETSEVVAKRDTQLGSVYASLEATVRKPKVSIIFTNRHNNDENGTESDIYKQLSQLEEKQDEITKRIQGELAELRENFQSLDSRLSKIETQILGKSDVDHAAIKSRIDEVNKVEKIFEEEFGLLREKIHSLKTQKTVSLVNESDTESRRQLIKKILYEETKPKVLGNSMLQDLQKRCSIDGPSKELQEMSLSRSKWCLVNWFHSVVILLSSHFPLTFPASHAKGQHGSKSASAGSSMGGPKRKYSTQCTEDSSVKQPKLDSTEGQKLASTLALNSGGNLPSNHAFIVNSEGYVEVYTDGACEKNGRRGAKAGVGVWFGDNHPLNISEPVVGRATNNTAEIQAATYAVETAKKAGVKKLLIHTDSNFLISCITQWIKKWKKNEWRVQTGEPVKNKDDLIVLDNKLQGIDVKWNHVRGHRGIHGNEMADHLAREGAKRYVQIAYDDDDDFDDF